MCCGAYGRISYGIGLHGTNGQSNVPYGISGQFLMPYGQFTMGASVAALP